MIEYATKITALYSRLSMEQIERVMNKLYEDNALGNI